VIDISVVPAVFGVQIPYPPSQHRWLGRYPGDYLLLQPEKSAHPHPYL
jgi:hypothetical protein